MKTFVHAGETRSACRLPALVVLLAAGVEGVLAQAEIDVRNFIPGVLDAPVYHIDGTTRLSNFVFCAQVFAGPAGTGEGALTPIGTPVPFHGGIWAGYFGDIDGSAPVHMVVPGVLAGQPITVQVRAWESYRGPVLYPGDYHPPLWQGKSKLFTLPGSTNAAPLVGLSSFHLEMAGIGVERQGTDWLFRWPAGYDPIVTFDLDATLDLGATKGWHSSGLTPVLDTADSYAPTWVVRLLADGPRAFYRLRFLHF